MVVEHVRPGVEGQVDQQDDEAGEEHDRDEMQSALQVGKGREDARKGAFRAGVKANTLGTKMQNTAIRP
jgi:hypothetical protein